MRVFSALSLVVVGALCAATVSGVAVQTTAATNGLALDATVSAHQSSKTNSVTSPAFSTTQAGDLIVAFAGADGPSPGAQAVSSITGGGLSWQLARRTNTQAGTAEVWTATAPAVLKNATVKASYSGSYMGSLTVAAFSGARTTLGATGSGNARSGAPTATVTSTRAGSWVWGVGNDWDGATARTVGTGQTKVDEYLASAGDTFWVQRQSSPGTAPAGTPVTLNDTAPTNHRWNLTTVEILPAGDTAAPTSPSGLSASVTGPSRTDLNWTAATDNVGVTGYNVYRSTTSGFSPSAATLVKNLGTVTIYTDTGLAPGTYYYVVTALDAAGNVGPASNQASAVLADTVAPTAPTGLTATVANAKVTLAWTAGTDAVGVTGYTIYRSTTAGFTPDAAVLQGTATTTGYVDMSVPAGTYYYLVTARDAAGNTSSPSAAATAVVAPSDTVAPSAPGAPTFAQAGPGQVAVSWTSGSDDVGVAGYNVYRSTAATFQPDASSLVGTATTTTYTDTITPGTYYYAIAAYDAAGNLSAPSPTAGLTLTDAAPPTVPTNLTAKAPSPTQVDLTWAASTDDVGVASYTVYRNGNLLATVAGTAYSNTGLTAGTAYSYSVAASDAAGNTSTQSAPVAVTTPTAAGGTVVFDDEFNGTSVDPGLWSVGNRPGDASNSEKQCYKPSNVTEAGGYLQINSKVDSSCSGYAYTSGMVQWNTFSYTYGTLEYRAKQPAGTGTWPAQWLLGSNCQAAFKTTAEDTGGCNWPQAGSDEIDVSEFKSSTTVDWQNVVSGNSGFLTCKPTVSNANTNWHVYQLVWKPGSLVWKVDGVTTCTQTRAVPTTPMFMIINTALGGGGGGTIKNSTLPQTMLVDYVKLTQ